MHKSRFSELLKASFESQETGADDVSLEAMTPRARAVLKSILMGADPANYHFGSKVENLAKKIAKLEQKIEDNKAAMAAAKNAKITNESIEVSFEDLDEVTLEGIKGGWKGYKEGAKAFWTKDGKLSFPSFKRYHDWLEMMQKDVDEKKAQVKELKAELKKLIQEKKAQAKAKVSTESTDSDLSEHPATDPVNVGVPEAGAPVGDPPSAPVIEDSLVASSGTGPVGDDTAAAPAPEGDKEKVAEDTPAEVVEEEAGEQEHAEEVPAADDEPAAVTEVVVTQDVSAESVEAALLDANEVETEISSLENHMDRVEEILVGLESVCHELEASLEAGGLSPSEAKLLNLAVEAYTSPLGLEDSPVPSTESFESASNRVLATQISLESVKEVWDRLWAFIKQLMAKVWKAIVRFVQFVTSASKRLKMRATRLKQAAKRVKGSPKDASIELGGLFGKLAIGDKIPANAVSGLELTYKTVQGLTDYDSAAIKINVALGKALHAVVEADSDDAADKALETFKSAPKLARSKAYPREDKGSDGSEAYATDILPGNMSFYVMESNGSVQSGVSPHKAELAEGKSSVLSLSDINRVADLAVKMGKFAESYGKSSKLFIDEQVPELKGLQKANDKVSDPVAKRQASAIRSFARNYNEQRHASMRLLSYSVRVGLNYIAYAERSLAQYGGEGQKALNDD